MKIANWSKTLKNNFLFQAVSDKLEEFKEKNSEKEVINMGIGDVSLPLADEVINACISATNEMGKSSSFRGYSPNGGYDFLKLKIKDEYKNLGILVNTDEIFISDGAKSDMSNILDIFSSDNTCLIPDPVYPVYLDTSIMNGMRIEFANATEQNNFLPEPDFNKKVDIIYICSPNNPTGAAYTKIQMKSWIDYANSCGAVILYDAAYEAFIEDDNFCRSIFEIPESKTCAIEFKSFSKSAGFTGMRCGYSIVPKDLKREKVSLNYLWNRRHSTKFNGVPYIIQRAAEASLSDAGKKECQKAIKYYKENAQMLAKVFSQLSIKFFGGLNSPYLWIKCPNNMNSWEFFDYLLQNLNIIGTPGSGFGKNGENYFRFSCFASRDDVQKACSRLMNSF